MRFEASQPNLSLLALSAQVSDPELTQAVAPTGGIYASYVWAPPCDLLRGRGTHYTYTGPNRLETYAACFVADDLTRGPAVTRLKSLPLCVVFPLLKCTSPVIAITQAYGYETRAVDRSDGSGSFFVVSAYGVLRLSFSVNDDSDATSMLHPVVSITSAAGASASVPILNMSCNSIVGGKCSAIDFSVSIAGQVANAGKNQTICATVTNDQVNTP